MKRIALISSLIYLSSVSAAYALGPVQPQGLLSTNVARALLEKEPGVVAARQALNVGQQDAKLLSHSPYEWTPSVGMQQRRSSGVGNSQEWNAGISKGIRLPQKAAADQALGNASIAETKARYGEAIHEAARSLTSLWVDWLAAEQALVLANKNIQSAQESVDVVEKRNRAGDASKLDMGLARTEWLEQKRLHSEAQTNVEVSWSKLTTRFPDIARNVQELPMPQELTDNINTWRERILSESDELKALQAMLEKSKAQLERTRAEQTPDPTVGVFTASEARGNERIIGINFSIPLAGELRSTRVDKAAAETEVVAANLKRQTRELETEVNSMYALAQGSINSWLLAKASAISIQENAALMQRAYMLGEVDIQTMLLAKRQAIQASNSILHSQATALKAYYALLVDAHLIWDLAKD